MIYISAYFLMMFYRVIMLKPLIPVIGNTGAHIFSEAEHIFTIHAKSRRNHAGNDLSKTAVDNDYGCNPASLVIGKMTFYV